MAAIGVAGSIATSLNWGYGAGAVLALVFALPLAYRRNEKLLAEDNRS